MPNYAATSLSQMLGRPEAPWPIDVSGLRSALGWVRATAPRATLGGMWRMLAGSGTKPGFRAHVMPGQDDYAYIAHLESLSKHPLREARQLAGEGADWLRGRGFRGVEFQPIADAQASAAARVRLFEMLMGNQAQDMGENIFRIPFGP